MEAREMHKVVCSDCGNECEVPFKPNTKRPVYCRECFAKKRSLKSSRSISSVNNKLLFSKRRYWTSQ